MSKNTATFHAHRQQSWRTFLSTGLSPFPSVANTCAIESSLEERVEQMWSACGWLGPARQRYVACRKDDPLPREGGLCVQPPLLSARFSAAVPQLSTGLYGLCHEGERNPAQERARRLQKLFSLFLRWLGNWEGRNELLSWCSPESSSGSNVAAVGAP